MKNLLLACLVPILLQGCVLRSYMHDYTAVLPRSITQGGLHGARTALPAELEAERQRRQQAEQARAEQKAEEERRRQEQMARNEQLRQSLPCEKALVTGVAAIYPHHLEEIYQSEQPGLLLARNPISCEYSEWGGRRMQGGGTINRSRSLECYGAGYFQYKPAIVTGQFNDLMQVLLDVDFPSGRRTLSMFVREEDMRCVD